MPIKLTDPEALRMLAMAADLLGFLEPEKEEKALPVGSEKDNGGGKPPPDNAYRFATV